MSQQADILNFPSRQFLMIRYEYVQICNDEIEAKILRIVESWMQRGYEWVSLSYKQIMEQMYSTVRNEKTIIAKLKSLISKGFLKRRPNPDNMYAIPQYQIDVEKTQKAIDKLNLQDVGGVPLAGTVPVDTTLPVPLAGTGGTSSYHRGVPVATTGGYQQMVPNNISNRLDIDHKEDSLQENISASADDARGLYKKGYEGIRIHSDDTSFTMSLDELEAHATALLPSVIADIEQISTRPPQAKAESSSDAQPHVLPTVPNGPIMTASDSVPQVSRSGSTSNSELWNNPTVTPTKSIAQPPSTRAEMKQRGKSKKATSDVEISQEEMDVYRDWCSLFKVKVPLTPSIAKAAEALIEPCAAWTSSLGITRTELLKRIKDWLYQNDKSGYYSRGVKLYDVSREFEGWQSAQERPSQNGHNGNGSYVINGKVHKQLPYDYCMWEGKVMLKEEAYELGWNGGFEKYN